MGTIMESLPKRKDMVIEEDCCSLTSEFLENLIVKGMS